MLRAGSGPAPRLGPAPVLDALPFSVDSFSLSTASKPHQFLTHAHKDHCVDITEYGGSVWCTATTRKCVLNKFPGARTATFTCFDLGDELRLAGGWSCR
jgi:hypothetical protein